MSTSLENTVFGPSDDPDSTTLLPYTVVSRECYYWIMSLNLLIYKNPADGRCALTITTNGPEDETDWFSIWSSAVYIAGICVAQGKQGRQTRLGAPCLEPKTREIKLTYSTGDKEFLTVELSDPSVMTSTS